jgi:hypothetical protein
MTASPFFRIPSKLDFIHAPLTQGAPRNLVQTAHAEPGIAACPVAATSIDVANEETNFAPQFKGHPAREE